MVSLITPPPPLPQARWVLFEYSSFDQFPNSYLLWEIHVVRAFEQSHIAQDSQGISSAKMNFKKNVFLDQYRITLFCSFTMGGSIVFKRIVHAISYLHFFLDFSVDHISRYVIAEMSEWLKWQDKMKLFVNIMTQVLRVDDSFFEVRANLCFKTFHVRKRLPETSIPVLKKMIVT